MNQIQVVQNQQSSLIQQTEAEIDKQIATAKKYPRDIQAFMKATFAVAISSPEVAASCFYSLARKKKDGSQAVINGPTIRLAEIAASQYKNLRVMGRVLEISDTHVKVQGAVMDLENNNAWSAETMRRITTRTGQRYSEDMIQVTTNAAIAIAVRNAVFKAIPAALIKEAFDGAMKLASGKGGDKEIVKKRWDMAVEKFEEMGVSEDMLLKKVGKKSANKITAKDLQVLLGTYSAIQDNETTTAEEFDMRMPEEKQEKAPPKKADPKPEPASEPQKAAPATEKHATFTAAFKAFEKVKGTDTAMDVLAAVESSIGKERSKWSAEDEQVAIKQLSELE